MPRASVRTTAPIASSSGWCSSATTTPRPVRRTNCVSNSCPAPGAPVFRSRKSVAPRRSTDRAVMDFDAIVIGSGISGGWAAKELCERGLRTLLIERGRHVNHKADYQDFSAPWELSNRGQVPEDEARRHYAIQSTSYAFNSATQQWWVKDSEHPYLTPEGREFHWLRGYHLGGRSLTWARQTY